jgi:hypothetical protein
MFILKNLIEMFLSKKKIIGLVGAVIIAAVAAFFGMSPKEVKEAVVQGPEISVPAISQPPPAPEKK